MSAAGVVASEAQTAAAGDGVGAAGARLVALGDLAATTGDGVCTAAAPKAGDRVGAAVIGAAPGACGAGGGVGVAVVGTVVRDGARD